MTQLYSTCKPLYVQLDRAVASYGVLKVVDTKYSRHFASALAQDQRFVKKIGKKIRKKLQKAKK